MLAEAAGADAGGVDGGSDGDAADEVEGGVGADEDGAFLELEDGEAGLGGHVCTEGGLAGPEGLVFIGGEAFEGGEDDVVAVDGIDIDGLEGGDIDAADEVWGLSAGADEGEEVADRGLAEDEGGGFVAELDVGEELTTVDAPDAEDFGDFDAAADVLAFTEEEGAAAVPDGFIGGAGAFGEGGAEEGDGAIDAADTGEGAEELTGGEGWRGGALGEGLSVS